MFIPDPDLEFYPSRIPHPGSKRLRIPDPHQIVSKLSEILSDVHPGSRSWFLPILDPDPGVKKGTESATLVSLSGHIRACLCRRRQSQRRKMQRRMRGASRLGKWRGPWACRGNPARPPSSCPRGSSRSRRSARGRPKLQVEEPTVSPAQSYLVLCFPVITN